jgi:hypothetical protein
MPIEFDEQLKNLQVTTLARGNYPQVFPYKELDHYNNNNTETVHWAQTTHALDYRFARKSFL